MDALSQRTKWQQLWPPPPPPASVHRITIFAHFAANHRLSASLLHQLQALASQSAVLFVTQSRLSRADCDVLAAYCTAGVLHIPQCPGLDHSSYRQGFAHVMRQRQRQQLPHLQWLWLVNDSYYGPLCSLDVWQRAVQRMEQSNLAAWGLTNSFQITYHLQSYFRAFRSSIFSTDAFAAFMAKPWHTMDYQRVVQHGELAIFREVVHPHPTSALRSARVHETFNPTFADWRGTLQHAFALKKKLLRSLPVRAKGQLRSMLWHCGLSREQLQELMAELGL